LLIILDLLSIEQVSCNGKNNERIKNITEKDSIFQLHKSNSYLELDIGFKLLYFYNKNRNNACHLTQKLLQRPGYGIWHQKI